ncbi:hypothetical protein ACMHYB_21370 [Sorangium sp. So ce1128]
MHWATLRGKAFAAMFSAAFEPLLPLVDKERADPHIYQTLAELHELRADWLISKKKGADRDWASGLAMADKALSINSHTATALASKGALLLSQARATKREHLRREAARQAKDLLEAALRENPLLSRARSAALKEAADLLARQP